MKFKRKYKWSEKQEHFRDLNLRKEIHDRLYDREVFKVPLMSFLNSIHWSEKDLSVIANSGGAPRNS